MADPHGDIDDVMTYIKGRMPMNAVIYLLVRGLVFLSEIRKRFSTKKEYVKESGEFRYGSGEKVAVDCL